MVLSQQRLGLGLLMAISMVIFGGTSGCGPSLDHISELNNLRIMGVHKSASYARPGETVHLQMLWEDGRKELPKTVSTFFGFWCVNPPGGAYSECFVVAPSIEPQFEFGVTEFDLTLPKDSIPTEQKQNGEIPSGTAFVFYGVCAGTLEVPDIKAGADDPNALVPACLGDDGKQVSADDFVIGYSQIFIFEELRNKDPILTGLVQDGKKITVDCINEECKKPFELPQLSDCVDGVICLQSCENNGDSSKCAGTSVGVQVDPASAEVDALAASFGTELEESIWVSYFIDRGSLGPELKSINDSNNGFQSDFSTNIYAPKESGPVRVWAVVRDNRGGIAWLRAPGFVKAQP